MVKYHNILAAKVFARIRKLSDTGWPWQMRDTRTWLNDGHNNVILRYRPNQESSQVAYRIPWPTDKEPDRVLYLRGAGDIHRAKPLPAETLTLIQTDVPNLDGFVDLSNEGMAFITWANCTEAANKKACAS